MHLIDRLLHPQRVCGGADRVKCFSVNEGNWPYWNDHMKAYIDWIKTADPETKARRLRSRFCDNSA